MENLFLKIDQKTRLMEQQNNVEDMDMDSILENLNAQAEGETISVRRPRTARRQRQGRREGNGRRRARVPPVVGGVVGVTTALTLALTAITQTSPTRSNGRGQRNSTRRPRRHTCS